MATAMINFRTNAETKAAAFEVFKSYGLSPSQALNMILTQVARTRSVPVNLDYNRLPNAQTLAAIAEFEQGNVETFDSLEDFHRAMLGAESETQTK